VGLRAQEVNVQSSEDSDQGLQNAKQVLVSTHQIIRTARGRTFEDAVVSRVFFDGIYSLLWFDMLCETGNLPYSDLARRDYEMGFAQQCRLVRSVQICVFGDGVQGKGSPSPASAIKKPGIVGFRLLFWSDNAAHAVQMVADEVFCWLPRMGAVRGVLRLRV